MISRNYRSLFMAVSVLAFGCASATLQVPNHSAASPEAPTMPVAQNESVLAKDFDPWADDAGAASDPHAHHHGAHSNPTDAAPRGPSDASGHDHQHEVHDHE